MLDNDLRMRRLVQEANDSKVAIILLDVVLGYGAHPDPASELAPAIAAARDQAHRGGRNLKVIAVVIGTDEDPQDYTSQAQRLADAGARVETDHAAAVRYASALVRTLDKHSQPKSSTPSPRGKAELLIGNWMSVTSPDPAIFDKSFSAINVGLESFYESLKQQGISAIHVDWRPPAGGNEKLMAILERLKK
jgi:FdrA protein